MFSINPVMMMLLLTPAMARAGGTGTELQDPSAADRSGSQDRPYTSTANARSGSLGRTYISPSAADKSVNRGQAFVLPQYPEYTRASGPDQTRHMMPMAGPPGGFYRSQLQDKSTYRSSGFLTSKSAPSLALGYSPRDPSSTVQDYLQNRLGSFNLLPNAAIQHRFLPSVGGLYQPVGGFGTKTPVGHSLPLIPPYQMRDSRVYDNVNYKSRDPTKKTGMYVVPSPSKLYYDGVKQ